MGEQRVDQGAARVARRRMDHEAGGLVEHEQVLVLEHDVERARLRLRQRRPRLGQAHRVALTRFDPARSLGYHRIVAPDLACLDQVLEARARQLRPAARQKLVEALAGIVGAGGRGQGAAHARRLAWTTFRALLKVFVDRRRHRAARRHDPARGADRAARGRPMIRSCSRTPQALSPAGGRADRAGGGRRPPSGPARQRRGGRAVPRRGRSRDRGAPQPVARPSRVGAGPAMAARPRDHEVTIEAIGARGDGVARLGAARVFVPLTLPGDRLRVRIAGRRGDGLVGEPVEWLEQAPRAEPPCPHFGACGGCQLQHVPPAQYARMEAPAGRGGARPTRAGGHPGRAAGRHGSRAHAGAPASRSSAGARRSASASGSEPDIGVIALGACPVLVPQLVALLPPLRRAARAGSTWRGPAASSRRPRARAASICRSSRRMRRAWPIARRSPRSPRRRTWPASPGARMPRRRPSRSCSGARRRSHSARSQVELPPGAFLQASEAAEAAIRDAVDDGDRRRRGASPTCSPAAARSACRSPRPGARCMRSSATRPCSRRCEQAARRAGLGGARHDRTARSAARAARRRRARPLRCARGRSAARRRSGAGRGARRVAAWRASRWSPATRRPSRATPGSSSTAAGAASGSGRSTPFCGRAGSSWWARSTAPTAHGDAERTQAELRLTRPRLRPRWYSGSCCRSLYPPAPRFGFVPPVRDPARWRGIGRRARTSSPSRRRKPRGPFAPALIRRRGAFT